MKIFKTHFNTEFVLVDEQSGDIRFVRIILNIAPFCRNSKKLPYSGHMNYETLAKKLFTMKFPDYLEFCKKEFGVGDVVFPMTYIEQLFDVELEPAEGFLNISLSLRNPYKRYVKNQSKIFMFDYNHLHEIHIKDKEFLQKVFETSFYNIVEEDLFEYICSNEALYDFLTSNKILRKKLKRIL